MPTILIAKKQDDVSEDVLKRVRDSAPGYDLLFTTDRDEMRQAADRVEVAAAGLPHALIGELPGLKWFQQWGAGADWLRRYPELQAADFVLTNASGVHPVQIGEHVFALLLAFARRLPSAFGAQREARWLELDHSDVFELRGQTLLLVGVGAIGERIATLATAFDMTVVGVRRDPEKGVPGVSRMVAPQALEDELPNADAVVLTVPLTDETHHLLGAEELGLMKDSATLVNIGRGGTVDEDALLGALRAGRFRGVGLDVFEEEPLPEASPLWGAERLVITSHYAGLSPRYDERAFDIFLDNLRRYVAGEELQNVVDKRLGY